MDAAFSPSSSCAGIGCIVRNDIGSWVKGWSSRLFAPNPFVCEILAIREGLRYYAQSLDKCIIASDCLVAVNSILSSAPPCGLYTNIILECRDLLENSHHLKLMFEKRSANEVADALAKFSLKDTTSCNGCFIWDFAPSFVSSLCTTDFVSAIEPLPPDQPP
ncbi:uncharacterized protein LOC141587915 [Silene latifolia]|uniref:uncharacterized protein LOC141587915 n=1 Tax=Silene latifolia TaxID=37657 RepID=UPI003D778625